MGTVAFSGGDLFGVGWGEGDEREEELVNLGIDWICGLKKREKSKTTSSPLAWEGGS